MIPTKKAQPIQKFTSFFKSIIVELDRDPDMFPEGNITEVSVNWVLLNKRHSNPSFFQWHKQASSTDSDGIELKRKGDVAVNARIILVPDFNPNKYKVASGLSDLIMLKLATKPHVITEVWNYVKVK